MDTGAAPPDGIESLGASILGDGLPFWLNAAASARHADRCAEFLELLGPGDSLLRIKVLTSRAVALAQVDVDRALTCASEAEGTARRVGGVLAQAYALVARSFSRPTPEFTDERLAAAREVLHAAAAHEEPALVPVGSLILLVALLEKGEIRTLDIELIRDQHRGRHAPDPERPTTWFRTLRAILDGDAALAEELVEEQLHRVHEVEGSEAVALRTTQLGIIRWMQGRVDGAEDGFLAARRAHPEQALWAASLVWLWALQGRRAAAESLFASLQDLDQIRRDRYWLSTMTVLAEVATLMGSRTFAGEVRRRLAPFAGHLVPVGTGVAFWGTCSRSLGLLEERLGLLADAREHLELAVELTQRIGAQAWLAEAQIELAEFALRHSLGDVPAYELLAEAAATCRARGFEGLLSRTRTRPRIRVMGRFEVRGPDGTVAEWSSRKARELLKMLVAARGVATCREVFMDVLWPGLDPAALANRYSVAVNAIRRALDPGRSFPLHHHVVTDGDSLRLNLDNVDVDLERFHALARRPDAASRRAAAELHEGGAFPEDRYADWAVGPRDHAEKVWASLEAPSSR